MPVEIVGQPWSEHGCACLQLRIPGQDGSNLEPIARIPLAELADQPDDAVAAHLAEAVAAEVARVGVPLADVPPALARVLANLGPLSPWEPFRGPQGRDRVRA
jgi:hypothetical protein